jgi:hypothetical protein
MTQNNEREAFEKCRIDEGYVLSDGSMSNENYELTEKWFLLGRQSILQNKQQPKQMIKGGVWLPAHPTREMWEKMAETSMYVAFDRFQRDYQSMLNASPLKQMTDVDLIPDNELRDLVNELTKVAKDYAHTQQLRARISSVVLDGLAKYRKNHRMEVEIGNSGK